MTPEENRRGTIPQGIPLGSICIPQSENPQIGHLRTPELTMMIWEGNQPPRQINLASFQKNTLIIGRSPECDIRIESILVSRRHAKLVFTSDGWTIFDLNSTNGLSALNRLISSKRLRPGDQIRIDDLQQRRREGVLLSFESAIPEQTDWHQISLAGQNELSIGRSPDNTICLPYVGVSRLHARILRRGDRFFIQDCNSRNGVILNGRSLQDDRPKPLQDKDVITITNTTLLFMPEYVLVRSDQVGIHLKGIGLVRKVKDRSAKGRKQKTILNEVNIDIPPGSFVSIIGGSGAGKSTVMNCLCGYNRMDKGTVTVNGLDLYNNYDNLKTMIGYVPQSDIVYRELSLQSMLLYSARLRLPKDSLQEELQASVDRVLKQVELSDHRSTLIGRLSGGQRKRASIAVELLSDPQLFFLDEPMSGLDPGTEKHLMKILRQMSRQGKTIIMVTHSTLNLAMFDQILFMGRGGNLCYAGPLQDALNYFKVEDVVDVYQLIDSRGTEYGDRYRQQFLGDRPFIESADQLDATSSYYSRPAAAMQSQKQQPADTAKVAAGKGGGNTAGKLKKSNKGTFFIQLSVLTRRYFELQINDRVRLLINLIQPVLLAVLLALVASDTVFEQYESTKSLLFALICCAYWIGTSDAISEIGKERVIFRREYMTGLRISSYLASKLIVLGALTFLQSALLTGGFAALVGLPESGLFAAPVVDFFITVFLATFAAANIALIVSALFKQQERAQSLAPLLLIPQILFSGSVFKLDGAVEKLSNLAVSRWAMEALGRVSDLNELPRAIDLELEGITLERTLEGFYTHELKALLENWGVLLLFSLVSCVIIALALRRIKNDQD